MKAMTYYKYGLPNQLQVEEVPVPAPKRNQVLVKTKYVSANPMEKHIMGGNPVARLSTGLFKPKHKILGADIAGVVEKVGEDVANFKPGDEVFGEIFNGSFAEYAVAPVDKITRKPTSVSFEDAAVTPVAGLTALQGLRDVGKVKEGDKVLINGASGGVGHFAVQMANHWGAEVTAVCSAGNHDFVKSIGASRAIDYNTSDFTKEAQQYDVIYDAIGNRTLADLRPVLHPQGRLVLIGYTTLSLLMKNIILGKLKSRKKGQQIDSITAKATPEDLKALGELLESGAIKPHISHHLSFEEIPQAIEHIISRRVVGKISIAI